MVKNKLAQVEPFNDFFFKSCYYHQIISGLSCFGISKDAFLLNYYTEIKNGLISIDKEFFNEKRFFIKQGCRVKKCNITRKKLIKSIDNGNPVIVGVDTFYITSRPDTYKINHSIHFILVYGYDLEQDEAFIIEHNYINSFMFEHKTMSLNNLLESNYYLHNMERRKKYTCRIITAKNTKKAYNMWNSYSESFILKNLEASKKNWDIIKTFINEFIGLRDSLYQLTKYLEPVTLFYYKMAKTEYYKADNERYTKAISLANGYANMLAFFRRILFNWDEDYVKSKTNDLNKLINKIMYNEASFYEYLRLKQNE